MVDVCFGVDHHQPQEAWEGLLQNDINHKILGALPKKLWESKVTSIKEANDLSTLAHDELIGKLLTYEMENDEDEKEDKKKTIIFKVQ